MIDVWFSTGSSSMIVDSIFTQSMLIVGITYIDSSINDDREDGRDGDGRDDDNNDDDEYIQHQDDNNGDDASDVHDDDDDEKDHH